MLEEISVETPEIKLMMKQFDIDRQEMIFYLCVLRTPNITISMISTIQKLDRTKAYRTASKLESKGLIIQHSTNPATLTAVKPVEAFDNLLTYERNRLKIIESTKDAIVKTLEKTHRENNILDDKIFSIVDGMDYSYSRIITIIKKAKERIDLILPFNELRRQYYGDLPEKIKEKKIPIRLITNAVTDEEKKFVRQIKNCEIKFLRKKLTVSRMIVTDNYCLTEIFKDKPKFFGRKDLRDTTNIMTNSKIMIGHLQRNFNYYWRDSYGN